VANSYSNDVSCCWGTATDVWRPSALRRGGWPSVRRSRGLQTGWPPRFVVANSDSNDISVLLGQGDGTVWRRGALRRRVSPQPSRWLTSTGTVTRTWRWPTASRTTSPCCWGTATGNLAPRRASSQGISPSPWLWVTSTGTVAQIWRSPTSARITSPCYWGTATGRLVTKCALPQEGSRLCHCGDFNGDGRPDVAVANSLSYDVSVLLGNGDGTFGAQVRLSTGFSPQSVAGGRLRPGRSAQTWRWLTPARSTFSAVGEGRRSFSAQSTLRHRGFPRLRCRGGLQRGRSPRFGGGKQ